MSTERLITFTHYNNLYDKSGVPVTASWEAWVETFSKHELRGSPADISNDRALNAAKNGACVVLGTIPEGQGHKNDNVLEMHALGVDLDSIGEEAFKAITVALASYEWSMYTTHKHGIGGAIKVRIVLPLRQAIDREKFRPAWLALQNLVGGHNDEQTKNPGRVFYMPSTYDLGVAWTHRNEGEWIDADELIATFGAPKDKKLDTQGADGLVRLLDKGRPGPELKEIAKALAKGEPLAPKGARHEAAIKITMWIAQKSWESPFSDDAIREVFAPSYSAMLTRDGEAPPVEEAIAAYTSAVSKAQTWEEQERAEKIEKAYEAQLKNAGGAKYDDADYARIADAQKVPHTGISPVEALRKRWIIQGGETAFYILAHDGFYRGPFAMGMARTAAVEILGRAPVLLNEPTRTGTLRRRGVQELTEDYGMCAVEIVADLSIQSSYFDEKSRRIYEAVRPLRRELVPHYDPLIDQWLRVFAGAHYGKLCDWLACAPDLTKLLCAIYVSGHPGAGKTLLAQGVARLWSDTPAEIDKALSDFNDEIVRCPLIVADEALPKQWKGNSITTKLRSILSTLERTLSRKYLPPCTLRGAIRMIITANNEFLLANKDTVSGRDLEAVAQRFLYIEAPEEATRWLESTVPEETRDAWAKGGLAAHALYLSQTRKVERGKRFWVEGDVQQMHRLLLISSDWTAKVCEFIARVLENPKPFIQTKSELIRWGGGELYVNAQAIIDAWTLYFPNTKVEPDTAKIGSALRAISTRDQPYLRLAKGGRRRFRRVIVDMLLGWAEKDAIVEKDAILARIHEGSAPSAPSEDQSDGANVVSISGHVTSIAPAPVTDEKEKASS